LARELINVDHHTETVLEFRRFGAGKKIFAAKRGSALTGVLQKQGGTANAIRDGQTGDSNMRGVVYISDYHNNV